MPVAVQCVWAQVEAPWNLLALLLLDGMVVMKAFFGLCFLLWLLGCATAAGARARLCDYRASTLQVCRLAGLQAKLFSRLNLERHEAMV